MARKRPAPAKESTGHQRDTKGDPEEFSLEPSGTPEEREERMRALLALLAEEPEDAWFA